MEDWRRPTLEKGILLWRLFQDLITATTDSDSYVTMMVTLFDMNNFRHIIVYSKQSKRVVLILQLGNLGFRVVKFKTK